MPNILPCLDRFFSSKEKYNVAISWQGKVFVVLAWLETIALLVMNTVLTDRAFTYHPDSQELIDDTRFARFYNVAAYFLILFFVFEACRAINKESVVELGISVSLAGIIAIWLTSHVIDPEKYEKEIYNTMGHAICGMAWAFFIIYIPLAWKARSKFGYRAWNKVGGLAQNQAQYEIVSEFRALLRLDMLIIALASMSAWYYVLHFPNGLASCIAFLIWSWIKTMWTRFVVKRYWTHQLRIFLFTCVDVIIAFAATIIASYVWPDERIVKEQRWLFWIYILVGISCLATRLAVVIFGKKCLDELDTMGAYRDAFMDSQRSQRSATSLEQAGSQEPTRNPPYPILEDHIAQHP